MIRAHAAVEQSSKNVTAVECTPLLLIETRYYFIGFRWLLHIRSLKDRKAALGR